MADQVKPRVYLAGAIRDGHHEDVEWRERVIGAVGDSATIFNPLAGRSYDKTTKTWSVCGMMATNAGFIVPHDFWHVDNCDICVFNFRALSDGYPNIGTLVEFGRATGARCLTYSIVDPSYKGHNQETQYHLHPFIERNSAIVFPDVDACATFLSRFLPAFTGESPRFGGYTVVDEHASGIR